MLRDLGSLRRNSGKASALEANNDENTPADASETSSVAASAAGDLDPATRPPLLTIQQPLAAAAQSLKRKTESLAPTPSKLPLRTPEKAAGRSRFGWIAPRSEASDNGEAPPLPPLAGVGRAYGMLTPRAYRTKAVSSAQSDSSSTQTTPSRSVTKPAYAGLSGSRPAVSGGTRGLGFSMAARGAPMSAGPLTVVNSPEVPHFELREDPSFWMENNVQVVIRVRPLNSVERSLHGYSRCLKQESAQSITWIGQPEARFTFDHVACETVNQEMLFRVAGLPMVENCMAGYNSCVFAYGQTGSGKTYTMLGEISELEVRPSLDRGMTPRIFEFLFARIRAEEESRRDEKLKYNCKCSFLEIYNEQITDLLDPSSTNLLLREDLRKGVYVENLTELEVDSVNDIIRLIMQGSANRKVAATNMNRESSRSHSVFTCVIESRWEKDATSNLRFARLNLVDLAGSERQKTSGAEGERLKEAASINKSLSTLGHVIMILADLAHGKQRHVPYRDSRLTFLLQESLGGNSKTMIVANVSPSVYCSSETLSTLKFAQRARLIQNNAVVNEDASGDVLALQHQIRLLKEELAVLKRQNVSRTLSFRSAIFERPENDVDDSMDQMSVDEENDDDGRIDGSLRGVRISNKQLKSLEATLAGFLRRETIADTRIKQLESEIELLNRLVRQREEDTRCTKMMLKFREDKIHRMEALLNDKMPAESYLLEDNRASSQEIELLRARVDKNPEVTRFAVENIRLQDQLRRFREFYEEGEREILLNEISQLRNQLVQLLDGKSELDQQNDFSVQHQDGRQACFSLASDNEDLFIKLKRSGEELESCRNNLQSCLETNEKLTREIAELHKELSTIKNSKQDGYLNVKPQIMTLPSESMQSDSHAPAYMRACSHEDLMRNAEEILNLQLELDILKAILAEERTKRTEVEERMVVLDDELKIARGRVLEVCGQQDTVESELSNARSVIEALESQQILLINELDELRESNHENIELLKKRELQISRLKVELDVHCQHEQKPCLANEEPKMQLLKYSENEDSPLQFKLKRMQASLEKARTLNTRYQSNQASHNSSEQEMDVVRRQVEVETAEVIMCLQEELIALQHQLDASNKNELLAKQRLAELETETKDLKEKLFEAMKENESFSILIEEKEREIRLLADDWERLAGEIGSALVDGNTALDEASDQVADISGSFSPRSWIGEQIRNMWQSISERDELIEELQNHLVEAEAIRCDLDSKLRSLRGATLAINEAHQLEKCDQEREICVLRSELCEKASALAGLGNTVKLNEEQIRNSEACASVAFITVKRLTEANQFHLRELERIELLLDESMKTSVQKEVLEECYASLQIGMKEQNRQLKSQVEQSKALIADLLTQTQEKNQAYENLKHEESTVLLRMATDVLKAKDMIHEFGVGVDKLHASLAVNLKEVNYQNADVNLEDRADQDPLTVFTSGKQRNFICPVEANRKCQLSNGIETSLSEDTCDRNVIIHHLSKAIESILDKLHKAHAQMVKVLIEKENVTRIHSHSQEAIKDLTAEILHLKSEIGAKEKYYEDRMNELENKMQEIEKDAIASSISWHKEKEALNLDVSNGKALAVQKSFEGSTLLAKLEEAQDTITDADVTVNALVEANENAKLQIKRHQQMEASLRAQTSDLLNEVQSLRSLLDTKEQERELMEKKFQSDLLEAGELVAELEDSLRHVQTLVSEKLHFVASDVDWMNLKLRQFTELARTWLEENWLEIIGKDCAVSVLHLCHMGILLERITGLNAENGFLQRGLRDSNSLISKLREHNDKAKNELEMCTVLKGKLLLDINHSFSRIAKKEQETTEFNSRLDSFEKRILHLQTQEEAMLTRSNSMYNELSILVEEIDATNRSALAAESKEKEELLRQLDAASKLNGMFKDSMHEELNLLLTDSCAEFQENNSLLINDVISCSEFEMYKSMANHRSELIMANKISKDIESLVVVSALKRQEAQLCQMAFQIDDLQKERVRFIEVLEGMKTEVTLGKIELELSSVAVFSLDEESSKLREDLKNLKQSNTEVMEDSHAVNEENLRLRDAVCSLESIMVYLQTDLDRRTAALAEVECSHAGISKELDSKAEIIELGIERENALRTENDLLKHELLEIVSKKEAMVKVFHSTLMSTFNWSQSTNVDVEKLFGIIQGYLIQISDQVHKHISEQLDMVSKFSNELDLIEVSVEKLRSENSFLQSELVRKDELSKGLLFDLSLLQESASITKDQSDELNELAAAIESLEEELASKSQELDEAVSEKQLLEAELSKSNGKIVALEEELSEKLNKLNIVYAENTALKSQMEHVKVIRCAIEGELADKKEVTERLEEELIELRNFLDQRDCYIENLQRDFAKLSDEQQRYDSEALILKEKLEMVQALAEENEAVATEARQVAEERKLYAEEKDEEVKLLERSIEELENTVFALENKVDMIKEEAERQRMQREELEVELQKVRHQMLSVPSAGKAWSSVEDNMAASTCRHSKDRECVLLEAQENIEILQKEVAEKESEVVQLKAHISELDMHAEAAAREYKQKFMQLEAMALQVKTDTSSANANSMRTEKISSKPRGSGSPFKCIGLGLVQQMNSEKEEELVAAKNRIEELEALAASRQREIFMLNARLAATESMTHDVIRDMLGVKMNMTTWAALVDHQQKMSTEESAISGAQDSKEECSQHYSELSKLKKQLNEFIEERQSWLDEINQRQAELGAARIATEKHRQREQFLAAENEMLRAENTNYKNLITVLEDDVKNLSRQQNLQLRINHHVKTKEENILLKKQNEELSAKLQQLGAILTRAKDELAGYRISNGKDPYVQIEEEELLKKRLQESEEDRTELVEKLSNLCSSVLKVAGVTHPTSDASLLAAVEALNQLQVRITSLENEGRDLQLKCKMLREKARLSELRWESSSFSHSGTKESSRSPSLCSSPNTSSFR